MLFQRLTTYLKEVRIELKKVTWPTREETTRYTLTVIVVSIMVAIFLGGLDVVFQFVLNTFVL
ncbi:MAG: preprotein translocase subunit SecE [Candidatus Sungbacteria bacterium RIFCSPHIGHO2_02_FULL_47_11]|uniref:Protein translocase subunit SecE n=1 Tax=Candidatus Sungbacteria bacterium RIFCSPHIGHO2_02_FULL_47_11 TaxID=1802270 RepID=A0A1G2KNE3_9BACT|nr:MAG: preprotein translocase subunit SecE [Candidatus Sungbacteria bacterium RIFCSPHIGHO2_02_FULL_47_11]